MYKHLALFLVAAVLPAALVAGEWTPPVFVQPENGGTNNGDNANKNNSSNGNGSGNGNNRPLGSNRNLNSGTAGGTGSNNGGRTGSNTGANTDSNPGSNGNANGNGTGGVNKNVAVNDPATKNTGTPLTGNSPGTTNQPGTTPGTTAGTTVVNNVANNFQVVDLALGATQEIDISNSPNGNFQFTSKKGVISIQVGADGSITLTGVKGGSELQLQANPVPLAGVMGEYQSLVIKGVTKFVAKKVDDKIFISLRLVPDEISITYNDQTPANETRSKENYSFRFLVIGNDPLIIANGKTVRLQQNKTKLLIRSSGAQFSSLPMVFHQRDELVITFGFSIKPGLVSP